jgi:copper(I)-binding protein
VSRRTASAALVLGAVLLSGCGTGLHATTYKERGRMDAAETDIGGRTGLAVRNLQIGAPTSGDTIPTGGTAFVTGSIVNNGTSPDALVGAGSDVAGAATLLVSGSPTTEVALPAGGTAPGTWSIALTGLTRALTATALVPVTLEFRRAGRVTVQVPVAPAPGALEDRTPAQDPYHVE